MEDYHDAHDLDITDPRQAMRIEKMDDEKGVAEVTVILATSSNSSTS